MLLLWLILLVGIIPLTVALALMPAARQPNPSIAKLVGSSLLCTLAFNLTFFWQELWLVLAKAMTPGLHPILYHNDHRWTGQAPRTELLQGAGAVATLISGLICLAILTRPREASGTWRLFVAWLAFEGLFQSLSQAAIGAVVPGNDAGRAFAYLGLNGPARVVALAAAVVAMAGAGRALAAYWPSMTSANAELMDRGFVLTIAVPATVAVILLIPFREPREMIEVVLVPVVVHLLGIGWTSLGAVGQRHVSAAQPIAIAGPVVALLLILAVFRGVLAGGIAL